MKQTKNLLSLVISTIFVVLIIFACTGDSLANYNKLPENVDSKNNMMARHNSINDTLSINIQDGNYIISLTGNFYENDIISNLKVIDGENDY